MFWLDDRAMITVSRCDFMCCMRTEHVLPITEQTDSWGKGDLDLSRQQQHFHRCRSSKELEWTRVCKYEHSVQCCRIIKKMCVTCEMDNVLCEQKAQSCPKLLSELVLVCMWRYEKGSIWNQGDMFLLGSDLKFQMLLKSHENNTSLS